MYILAPNRKKLTTVFTTPCLASFSNAKHNFIFLFSERPIGDVCTVPSNYVTLCFRVKVQLLTNFSIFKGIKLKFGGGVSSQMLISYFTSVLPSKYTVFPRINAPPQINAPPRIHAPLRINAPSQLCCVLESPNQLLVDVFHKL